jgi:hypothetical protein
MTPEDFQVIGILFLICLPVSALGWAIALIGGGVVRDVHAMPMEFRLAARITGPLATGKVFQTVATGIGIWTFANLEVPLILIGPYGLISSGGAIVYVVVQLLWLERVRRAVRAERKQ